VGLGSVAAALAGAPWFNWTTDALSDLGHPARGSSPIFNAGLAAAGLLYLVFVAALARALASGRLATAAEGALAASALSLTAIGVLNESFGAAHFVVSFTYFMFLPLGMALLALRLWRSCPRFARVTLAVAAASASFGISIIAAIVYGWPFPSQAIPELIASSLLALWSLWAGAALRAGMFSGTAADAK
jgi:hypothetical membrane protein